MGQVIGKAVLKSEVKPFSNVPQYHIIDFWETFQDISSGYALTLKEFQETIRICFKSYIDYNDEILDALSKALFTIYDDDDNSLIDSLEFLSSIALISGMSTQEKIHFLFGLYDFEETTKLTMDEFILCTRVCVSGLNKISTLQSKIPTYDEIDALAVRMFYDNVPSNNQEEIVLDRELFTKFVLNSPEIYSWIQHFSDFEDTDGIVSTNEVDDYIRFPLPFSNTKIDYRSGDMTVDNVTNLSFGKNTNLELSWVYGRNCKGVANRPYYTTTGELIYAAGAVIVKQNSNKKQTFFMEHLDYISCFVVHKDEISASAESGMYKNSKIHVWSIENFEVIVSLNSIHKVCAELIFF